jgi:hypothetical protein
MDASRRTMLEIQANFLIIVIARIKLKLDFLVELVLK